jgi:hypothetical protein
LASRNQVFKGKIPLFWGRRDGIAGPRGGTLNETLSVGIKVRPDSASRIGEQNKGHTNTLDPNGDIDSRFRKL